MSFANVDIGNSPGDGGGDSLRSAFNKINQNFANIAESRIDVTVESPVQSVAGRTGNVVLTVADIPGATSSGYVDSQTQYAISTSNAYTDLRISTRIGQLLDSAPEALNTLSELATALGNDANFASVVTDRLSSLEGQISSVLSSESLAVETAERVSGDADLQTQITTTNSNLNAEITNRITAEASLQTSIDAETSRATDEEQRIEAKVDAEINRATDAELVLQNNIDALSGDLANLATVATTGSYNDLTDQPAAFDPTGLATETYVDTAIAAIPATDLTGLATETYVDTAIAAIPATDLTGLATETYVDTAVSNLVNAAPGTLDTLNELAAALGDDANFSTTVTNLVAGVQANVDTLSDSLSTANWNTAYGWGDHSAAGYLTSYTETDPVFSAWDKSTGITITESQISDLKSYLTAYTETDPVVGAITGIVKSDGAGNITAAVAGTDYSTFDGAYSSLSGAPTAVSAFTNDAGYLTADDITTDTGNFTFSENTLSVGNANGITIDASGSGEIVMSDNVGIKQANPGLALHIGSVNDSTPDEIGIAITAGNDTISGTVSLQWDWHDGVGAGSNSTDTSEHARFGIFKNGTLNHPWLTFDRDAPADSLAVNSNGDLLIRGFKVTVIVDAPAGSIGQAGDSVGMVAYDNSYYYYCTADYDGSTDIWKRVAWSGDTW